MPPVDTGTGRAPPTPATVSRGSAATLLRFQDGSAGSGTRLHRRPSRAVRNCSSAPKAACRISAFAPYRGGPARECREQRRAGAPAALVQGSRDAVAHRWHQLQPCACITGFLWRDRGAQSPPQGARVGPNPSPRNALQLPLWACRARARLSLTLDYAARTGARALHSNGTLVEALNFLSYSASIGLQPRRSPTRRGFSFAVRNMVDYAGAAAGRIHCDEEAGPPPLSRRSVERNPRRARPIKGRFRQSPKSSSGAPGTARLVCRRGIFGVRSAALAKAHQKPLPHS